MIHATVIKFLSAWYGWAVIMKDTKLPDCLWAAVSGFLMLIFFPSSSFIPVSVKIKVAL